MTRTYLRRVNALGFDTGHGRDFEFNGEAWVKFEKLPDGGVNVDSFCDVSLTPADVQRLVEFLQRKYKRPRRRSAK